MQTMHHAYGFNPPPPAQSRSSHLSTIPPNDAFLFKVNDRPVVPVSPYLTPPNSAIELKPDQHDLQSQHSLQPQPQIAISTAFYPGAMLSSSTQDVPPPDVVLQSGDSVFFYVHSALLRQKSSNAFNGLLTPTPVSMDISSVDAFLCSSTPDLSPSASDATLPASPSLSPPNSVPKDSSNPSNSALPRIVETSELAPLLNVVLHLLYSLPFTRYSPDYDTLAAVFPFANKYGLNVHDLVAPHSEMCSLLLSYAPSRPLDVYTLAAQNKLHELAVLASQFTLGLSLSQLTDAQSVEMGPLYLKWLFFLHLGRGEALKRILVKPFEPHPEDRGECSAEDQKSLARAWGLVTAYVLSTSSVHNVSVGMLNATYGGMSGSIRCSECKRSLEEQIRGIVASWTSVQSTI